MKNQPARARPLSPAFGRLARAAAAALVLLLTAAPALALDVGEEVEDFDVTEWIQGEMDVTANPDKKIRVVQFFNTAKPASVTGMDDMQKWQADYNPKGVEFLAVTKQGSAVTKNFIDSHKITFPVALDGYDNCFAEFLGDDGQPLPYAIVIAKDGVLEWQGAFGDELKGALDTMLDGTFDREFHVKLSEARRELREAGRDFDSFVPAAKKLLKLEPENSHAFTNVSRYYRAVKKDPEAYLEWARELEKDCGENSSALNQLAWDLVTNSWKYQDPELALRCAKKALANVEKPEMKSAVLDTVARAWFNLGRFEKAVELQKKAVKEVTAGDNEDIDEDALDKQREGLQETLDHYERMLKAQKAAK